MLLRKCLLHLYIFVDVYAHFSPIIVLILCSLCRAICRWFSSLFLHSLLPFSQIIANLCILHARLTLYSFINVQQCCLPTFLQFLSLVNSTKFVHKWRCSCTKIKTLKAVNWLNYDSKASFFSFVQKKKNTTVDPIFQRAGPILPHTVFSGNTSEQ